MPICLANSLFPADLGQAGDKGCGDREAEARDGGQDGITSGQAGVGLDALEDLAVECGNILIGSADAAIELDA